MLGIALSLAGLTINSNTVVLGSIEINQKLAKARAEAVKTLLQKKYGIKSSRIQAEGQGVGNMFSEPDWNRVAISTLTE